MSTEIWILLVLVASTGSALITYFLARRGAPTRRQLIDLEAALESARDDARQVEGRVSEHFERSAVLFGHLAKDYKAFLDHYSDSAKALGLSERRARELLAQGYQPLLTHLEQDVRVESEESATAAQAMSGVKAGAARSAGDREIGAREPGDRKIAGEKPDAVSSGDGSAAKAEVEKVPGGEKSIESTGSQPEPPLMKEVVDARASSGVTASASKAAGHPADQSSKTAAVARSAEDSARPAKVVAVDLSADADARAESERQLRQG